MTGKLKTRGNMMLATKLDGVLKVIWGCFLDLEQRLTNGIVSGSESKALSPCCSPLPSQTKHCSFVDLRILSLFAEPFSRSVLWSQHDAAHQPVFALLVRRPLEQRLERTLPPERRMFWEISDRVALANIPSHRKLSWNFRLPT
jgi:hypothetical protein